MKVQATGPELDMMGVDLWVASPSQEREVALQVKGSLGARTGEHTLTIQPREPPELPDHRVDAFYWVNVEPGGGGFSCDEVTGIVASVIPPKRKRELVRQLGFNPAELGL